MFNIWGKGGDGERPRRMSRDNRGFVFYLLALFLNSELIHSGLSLASFCIRFSLDRFASEDAESIQNSSSGAMKIRNVPNCYKQNSRQI